MYKGVWVGDEVFRDNNILILGESHYDEEKDKGFETKLQTRDVLINYLDYRKGDKKFSHWMNFFTKIAHCISDSYNNKQIIDFWNKVYFGNYINVLCGLKDGYAKEYLRNKANINMLNDELFQYVNQNNITDVICVSKLVFGVLPKYEDDVIECQNGKSKISMIEYKANTVYEGCGICLNKDLNLYCIPHPSGFGFEPKNYNEVFNRLRKRLGIH